MVELSGQSAVEFELQNSIQSVQETAQETLQAKVADETAQDSDLTLSDESIDEIIAAAVKELSEDSLYFESLDIKALDESDAISVRNIKNMDSASIGKEVDAAVIQNTPVTLLEPVLDVAAVQQVLKHVEMVSEAEEVIIIEVVPVKDQEISETIEESVELVDPASDLISHHTESDTEIILETEEVATVDSNLKFNSFTKIERTMLQEVHCAHHNFIATEAIAEVPIAELNAEANAQKETEIISETDNRLPVVETITEALTETNTEPIAETITETNIEETNTEAIAEPNPNREAETEKIDESIIETKYEPIAEVVAETVTNVIAEPNFTESKIAFSEGLEILEVDEIVSKGESPEFSRWDRRSYDGKVAFEHQPEIESLQERAVGALVIIPVTDESQSEYARWDRRSYDGKVAFIYQEEMVHLQSLSTSNVAEQIGSVAKLLEERYCGDSERDMLANLIESVAESATAYEILCEQNEEIELVLKDDGKMVAASDEVNINQISEVTQPVGVDSVATAKVEVLNAFDNETTDQTFDRIQRELAEDFDHLPAFVSPKKPSKDTTFLKVGEEVDDQESGSSFLEAEKIDDGDVVVGESQVKAVLERNSYLSAVGIVDNVETPLNPISKLEVAREEISDMSTDATLSQTVEARREASVRVSEQKDQILAAPRSMQYEGNRQMDVTAKSTVQDVRAVVSEQGCCFFF